MAPQHQVFFYQVLKFAKNFDQHITLSEESGSTTITTRTNRESNIVGYTLSGKLYDLAKQYLTFVDKLKLEDLGITILLLNFSKCYVEAQYHLFINDFEPISELENFERKLLKCSNLYFKLPKNLALHTKFGIVAQRAAFVNHGSITLKSFNDIFAYMASNIVEVEKFLEIIAPYHIKIVECFYTLSSFTRQTRIILESRDLNHTSFVYTIEKIRKSVVYNGSFWFVLPKNSVWFACHRGNVKKVNYISRDVENSIISTFKPIEHSIVVGIVHENVIYPIKIDDAMCNGKWQVTIDLMNRMGLNVLYKSGAPLYRNIHFVVENQYSIYKLCYDPKISFC